MLRLIRCSLINPIFILSCLLLPGIGLTIVFAEFPPSALVDAEGNRYINIEQTQSEILIDGLLSDEEWKNASFQKHFLQREPVYGEETSEETQVALLRDEDNLYLAVKCYDSSSPDIIANEMRRDARIDSDDFFEIVFDTFHDQRNGYYFIINPNGVKRDATLGDEGKSYNPDWDGIWDCKTQISDEGWFAEIAIPWKTLRFDSKRDPLWGINFARMIRRKNEHVFWQLISRDAGRLGLFRLSQAGELRGLSNLQSGGTIDFLPYLLGGLVKDVDLKSPSSQVKQVGLDATFAVTSNINLKISWNTDFAQVESDQEQVNLTRFSLYFPEKREFFLDGADIFNFGSVSRRRSSGGDGSENINLFYSRSIGILEEHQQPILGGMKLLGKIGSFQFGFLNMQTEGFDAVEEDEDTGENIDVKYRGSNYSIFRIKKDIFKRSSIGVMLLNKHHNNSQYYNRSGGIDAIFPLTETFTISGNIAATTDLVRKAVGINNRNIAGKFALDYNSDLWQFKASHVSIQEDFNAEMGFIPRTNIRKTSTEVEYAPRPNNSSTIRQYHYQIQYDYLTNQQNRQLENDIKADIRIDFQNSSRIGLGLNYKSEFIDELWEVRENLFIPVGTYRGLGSFAWVMTDDSKDISARIMSGYGNYYTGKRFGFSPSFVLKNIGRFRADINFGYDHVQLPDGSFDIRTVGSRIYFFLSTNLYIKAYLQWKDDKKANDGNRIALSNILFRWIYRPGSDVYLVYNEGWDFGPLGNQMSNRSVLLKFTYFWRN
jgi:hypothetical protein